MRTTNFSGKEDAEARRAFSVSALGRERWYWVVWPSFAQPDKGQASDPLIEGFASSKLEAIDQALAVAGANAHWLAASYARQHYKVRTQAQRMGSVAVQEFVYYDMRCASGWAKAMAFHAPSHHETHAKVCLCGGCALSSGSASNALGVCKR